MAIIDFLQNYFFQGIIYVLSYGGHLFVILGVASVIYIMFDKDFGARALIFYFTSMLANAYLKEWIGRPRPYTEGAHQIIENSQQPSMPSGHTQGLGAALVPTARRFKTKKAYILCAAFLLFIAFSRVYLGQHYVSDVLAGAAIGIAIGVGLELIYVFAKERAPLFLLLLIPVAVTLMAVFPGYRDAFVSAGILCASIVGVNLERRFVGYTVRGSWLNRIFKMVVTLVIGSVLMMPFVGLYSAGVMFDNLAIFFMFFMLMLGVTFVSPLVLTKVSFFDRVFNKATKTETAAEKL